MYVPSYICAARPTAVTPTMRMTEEYFRKEIMPCRDSMFRVAAYILEDRDDAADAVQTAMVRIWEHGDRLAEPGNAGAYCVTVARRTAIDMLRGRKPRTPLAEAGSAVSDSDVASRLEQRSELSGIGRLMKLLPESQRRVLMLSAVAGCSNGEIAAITGFSDANVRTILSRARTNLKLLYTKYR